MENQFCPGPLNHRENRRLLATFDRKEIAHLGVLKVVRFCGAWYKSLPQPQRIARFWCIQGFTILTVINLLVSGGSLEVFSLVAP